MKFEKYPSMGIERTIYRDDDIPLFTRLETIKRQEWHPQDKKAAIETAIDPHGKFPYWAVGPWDDDSKTFSELRINETSSINTLHEMGWIWGDAMYDYCREKDGWEEEQQRKSRRSPIPRAEIARYCGISLTLLELFFDYNDNFRFHERTRGFDWKVVDNMVWHIEVWLKTAKFTIDDVD